MPRKKSAPPEIAPVRQAPDREGVQVSMPHAEITAAVAGKAENPEGRATGTATVVVALKYSGLVLQGFKMESMNETTPVGFREVKKAVRVGEPVTLNGNRGGRGSRVIEIINGFAITEGVPEDLWNNWHKANERSAIVVNGLIFADRSLDRVRAECRNRKGIITGMEPIIPPSGEKGEKRDPRIERDVNTFNRRDEQVA